jgi:hypothetical protein
MSSRLTLRHVAFTACLGLLMVYQNCAQAPSDTNQDSASSYEESLPFAYTLKLDTISYMSCMDITDPVQTRGYYTFRVGAYRPPDVGGTYSGLGLSDDYLTKTQYYSLTDRARALSLSSANANALLTLSVRSAANYQQPWILAGSDAPLTPGFDVDTFLPGVLASDEYAGPLAATPSGQYRNYFPSQDDERVVEASLRAYNSKGNMDFLRQTLGAAYLVAGFSTSQDELDTNLRSSTDMSGGTITSSVLGSGFKVQFGSGRVLASSSISSAPARTLSDIVERNMDTGSDLQNGWDCSTQFMVVRPADVGGLNGKCSTNVDRAPANNAQAQKELDAIRRVLPVEDWFVDVVHHCAVPKSTIGDYCYGANIGTRVIQYTQPGCYINDNDPTGTKACPQYVSVCIRK